MQGIARRGMRCRHALAAAAGLGLVAAGQAGGATQQVFLDFDSRTGGTDRVYSPTEKAAILTNIAFDYSGFDFAFSLTAPVAGPFTTIFFNDGNPGGLAQEIDFRNLNLSTFAQVNINGLLSAGAPSADWIGLTTTVGAHELGHTVGVRHADSFGPIGSGITNPPGASPYLPDYPGPTNLALETGRHIMASPASVGQQLSQATADTYFGEREVVKLKFIETGLVVAEQAAAHGSRATAQPLVLADLGVVPNKLKPGDQNFGKIFDADAVTVTGRVTSSTELDYYSFSGAAGQLFNFEVMSRALNRYSTDNVDPEIRVFDSDGNLVPYFSSTAVNQDEFEGSFDSVLIDLTLPDTDTYFVEVSTDSTAGAGDLVGKYELFFYSFAAAVPEPGGLVALLLPAVMLLGRRRRRQDA